MRFLAVFILVFLTSCTQNNQVDANSLNPNSSRQADIGHGLTHIYFRQWDGPRVLVYLYVPWNVDPQTAPIMFMMHGAKRNAARYLSEWDEIAEREGFIVVAPELTKKDFPKSAAYNRGNVFERGSLDKKPEGTWSFSVIEPLFDHVVKRIGGQQQRYTFYGHSAGSQFVHRFMMFKPKARASRYLPANAGWYTFADLDIDYPYGLRGSGVSEADLKSVLQKDVVILLGDKDNDSNHKSLKRSDGAVAQGPHRFARGKEFYRNAKKNAEKFGVRFGWKLRVIEGIAHSNGGIAAGSSDLIK